MRYRAFGPDSNLSWPIILCPVHARILIGNMKRLAKDRTLDPTLDPAFDPGQVQIEPADQAIPCRVEYEGGAPCGEEAPGLIIDG